MSHLQKASHLSPSDLDQLMSRYYSGENIQFLLNEFQLDITPASLVSLFPPIIHAELLCPYCVTANMQSKRSARTSRQKKVAMCPQCSHKNTPHCLCSPCRKIRRNEEKEAHSNKERMVAEICGRHKPLPIPSQLTLKQSLYLLTCIHHTPHQDLKLITPYVRFMQDLAPSVKIEDDIIETLFSAGLIGISSSSPLHAFAFDDESNNITGIYFARIRWQPLPTLEIEEKKEYLRAVRVHLQDAWPIQWRDEAIDIWRIIVKEECLTHYKYLVEQRRHYLDSALDKMDMVFDYILDHFTPAQTFKLSYFAARDITDYNLRRGIPRHKSAGTYSTGLHSKAQKFLLEKWEITGTHRRLPQSILSTTFFDMVMNLGEGALDVIPPKKRIMSKPE